MLRLPHRLGAAGVLVEPASVVAKAWEQIERIGRRAHFGPGVAIIVGAGAIGLFAALMARRRGLETHVFDVVPRGAKPEPVEAIGARYHTSPLRETALAADIMIECTGQPDMIAELLDRGGPATITCLMGMTTGSAVTPIDLAAWNRRLVRQNGVVFGTVSANRRHYETAAAALGKADPIWLDRLVSRRIALGRYAEAFSRRPDEVKVILELAA